MNTRAGKAWEQLKLWTGITLAFTGALILIAGFAFILWSMLEGTINPGP